MTFHANDVTVILSCDHLTTAPLSVIVHNTEADFYCWACSQKYSKRITRQWVGVADTTSGYWFQCTQCPYKRHYGMRKMKCETDAEKHVRNRRHQVLFMLESELQRTLTPALTALPIGDAAPF